MIIDAIDCLLCNAGLLKIGSGYVAEHFQSSNFAFPQVKNNIIVCVEC